MSAAMWDPDRLALIWACFRSLQCVRCRAEGRSVTNPCPNCLGVSRDALAVNGGKL